MKELCLVGQTDPGREVPEREDSRSKHSSIATVYLNLLSKLTLPVGLQCRLGKKKHLEGI